MNNFEELITKCYAYPDSTYYDEEQVMYLFKEGFDLHAMVFGTTDFLSVVDVLRQMKPPTRFVVIGCSIGYQCFIWNHLFPEIPCVGIDILEYRVRWGSEMIKEHDIKNVELYIGDMFDLPLQDGDLIWQNNLMFDEDEVYFYNEKVLNMFEDVQIFSYVSIDPKTSEHSTDDIEIEGRQGPKTIKRSHIEIRTSWMKNFVGFYYYTDTPYKYSFGADFIPVENRMNDEELVSLEKMLLSRTRIKCPNMLKYYNKNEAKTLFKRHGLDVPELILYTTEETDISETLDRLDSFAAKPAHWSESVDVHIKKPGQNVDCKKISDELNKRLKLSDSTNWRRVNIGTKIHFKDTEKGIIVEEYIEGIYELKVFVVFGDPIVGDLRSCVSEMDNLDYIRKENKYLNWDKEHEILSRIAREIKVDFFRVDFIFDGEKLYANDITFIPGTELREDVEKTIEKRIVKTYKND